mgnify:CR=1 FL=1
MVIQSYLFRDLALRARDKYRRNKNNKTPSEISIRLFRDFQNQGYFLGIRHTQFYQKMKNFINGKENTPYYETHEIVRDDGSIIVEIE